MYAAPALSACDADRSTVVPSVPSTTPRARDTQIITRRHYSYPMWRQASPVHASNKYFEETLLPELHLLLWSEFESLPDDEREDAVQDMICQALVAYRALNPKRNHHTAYILAGIVSSQYLSGQRFGQQSPKYL